MSRSLFVGCLWLAGCAASGGAAEPDPWAEGAAFSPASKTDGTQPIVYATAETTASLVEGIAEDELEALFGERVDPALRADGATLPPWVYLRRMSALGAYGPIGPYGPLGVLGPLGGYPWSSELYVSGSFAWSDWSDLLTEGGGPLSADGPLGAGGPLNPAYWPEDAGFVSHLQPGGVFGVLGPVGPTGALGPLGPLGPVGAHGYARGEDGGYWPEDGGSCHDAPPEAAAPPCRRIEIEWEPGGERRVYDLFERYDEAAAKAMPDNDTSFMVIGGIDAPGAETDAFVFHSREDQWVMVAVVPEYAKYPYAQAMALLGAASYEGYEPPGAAWIPHLFTGVPIYHRYEHRESFDDFDLRLDLEGRGSIASRSGDHVDWIQVFVPAGTTLRASVSLHQAWRPALADAWWGLGVRPYAPSYRLYVVGATGHGSGPTPLSGPHLRPLH